MSINQCIDCLSNMTIGQWISPAVTGRGQPRYLFTLTSLTSNSAVLFGGNTPNGISNTVYIGHFTRSSVVSIIVHNNNNL